MKGIHFCLENEARLAALDSMLLGDGVRSITLPVGESWGLMWANGKYSPHWITVSYFFPDGLSKDSPPGVLESSTSSAPRLFTSSKCFASQHVAVTCAPPNFASYRNKTPQPNLAKYLMTSSSQVIDGWIWMYMDGRIWFFDAITVQINWVGN